jgi:hypothetical protein
MVIANETSLTGRAVRAATSSVSTRLASDEPISELEARLRERGGGTRATTAAPADERG